VDGSEEKQEDKGESGMQADQNDGNVRIDENDEGLSPEEEGDTEGGDETREPQDTGSALDLTGGKAGKPDELTEEDAAASQAVDQFDQMESGLGEEDLEAPPEGLPDTEGMPGSGIPMTMLEQWLERIEGDPAYLLRNQFMIEERQAMEQYGRGLMETRPW
jgi:Ca-activated chloride channel family protein